MRLIDADELAELYVGWLPQLVVVGYEGDKRGVETCIDVLLDAPTIDAVPVVRCGECKEYQDGDCYHPLAYGMGSMLRGLEPTDFCSYGERKE